MKGLESSMRDVRTLAMNRNDQSGGHIKMTAIDNYIKGTCNQMCPEDEIVRREKEGLLHIFETADASDRSKLRADRKRMVKSFSRSAAGKKPIAKDIRPPDVLLTTVHYLLSNIANKEDVPWNITYDFIMDRLRAVRQDLFIQHADIAHSIVILQPIVRFYAFASYKLCEEPISKFDPHINKTHLQECLKRLLVFYDEIDRIEYDHSFLKENRQQFEALYILFNLGDVTAIVRGLSLSKHWRTELVKLALDISLSYYKNKYVRVCRLMLKLPTLLMAVAYLHLIHLQKNALEIMSVAYNSKNLTFAVRTLREILLYNSDEEVIASCRHYGLEVTDEGIRFMRMSFDKSKEHLAPRKAPWIDERFSRKKISAWLLFGDYICVL